MRGTPNISKSIAVGLIRRNVIPLFLAITVVGFEFARDEVYSLLLYDRSAILDGQLWRLLSGHFIHMGWSHLGMNLAALFLIWTIAGKWLTLKEVSLTIILSAFAIGLGLLAMNPEISWYVGLSAVLHGIWAAATMSGMRAGRWEAYALFILLVAKLVWEQFSGPLPASVELSGGPVIVDAHLYGALSAILFWALTRDKALEKVE